VTIIYHRCYNYWCCYYRNCR